MSGLAHARPSAILKRLEASDLGAPIKVQHVCHIGAHFLRTGRYRLPDYDLWRIEEGTTPKYFLNTRLKCDELEKPQEKATSVIVLPPWVSSS
jgi:hypothetical protein